MVHSGALTARRLAAVFLAGAAFTAPAFGQVRACSFDTAQHRDTITMYVALGPSPDSAQVRRATYLNMALAIGDFFKPPHPLGLPAWPGTYDPRTTGNSTGLKSAFGLAGKLVFRVDERTGRLSGHLEGRTGGPNLSQALEAAVKAADRAGRFGPLTPETLPRDGDVELFIREVFNPIPDGVMLMQVRFPAIRIDGSVLLLSDLQRDMKFPAAAQFADAEDDVTAQFVVDEDGRMDPKTFWVVDAKYIEFVDAVREFFEHARFRPAMVGACPVRGMLTFETDFRLTFRRDGR